MEEHFTAQDIIKRFNEKLYQADQSTWDTVAGDRPCFPMFVAYLGDTTDKISHYIQDDLSQMWLSLRDELKFIALKQDEDGVQFSVLNDNDKNAFRPAREINDIVSKLFETNTHFKKYTNVLIYYIADSSVLQSAEELSTWFTTMEQLKTYITDPVMDMLILLLDESGNERQKAIEMQAWLAEHYESLPALLLISNRRSDNRITDRAVCCRIATAAIAVSNNVDSQIVINMFEKCVMTAGYAREEKPFPAISQFCVNMFLEELSNLKLNNSINLLSEPEQLKRRLGIAEDGNFTILNEYAATSFQRSMPKAEELDLFPLPSPDNKSWNELRSAVSSREFNALTFGAWECYLENIIRREQEKMNQSSENISWIDRYTKLLRQNFTAEELNYLAEHIEKVKELMYSAEMPSPELSLSQYAKARLCYLLSSDEKLIQSFYDKIKELGEQARIYLHEWKNLLHSRINLPELETRVKNFVSYYKQPLQNYFDVNNNSIHTAFQKVADMNELNQFVENTIANMFMDKSLKDIFGATFKDVGIVEQIQQTLSYNVPVYMQTVFDLGTPVLSFILLKTEENDTASLYYHLKNTLPDRTRYYNTGCGSAAESLHIYRVDRAQLFK